jgi:hypothetical protein
MEEQEEKKAWIATSESVRWMTYCGVSGVLNKGEWWTLKSLMEIEARLITTNLEYRPKHIGGWFGVRVGQELVKHTGLSRTTQYAHLETLQHTWHLIESRMEEKRRRTEVRFVIDTIERLARYSLPLLRPYEGGLFGVTSLPEYIYYWIRPDLEDWNYGWTTEEFAALMGKSTGPGTSLVEIRKILLEPDYTT